MEPFDVSTSSAPLRVVGADASVRCANSRRTFDVARLHVPFELTTRSNSTRLGGTLIVYRAPRLPRGAAGGNRSYPNRVSGLLDVDAH